MKPIDFPKTLRSMQIREAIESGTMDLKALVEIGTRSLSR